MAVGVALAAGLPEAGSAIVVGLGLVADRASAFGLYLLDLVKGGHGTIVTLCGWVVASAEVAPFCGALALVLVLVVSLACVSAEERDCEFQTIELGLDRLEAVEDLVVAVFDFDWLSE